MNPSPLQLLNRPHWNGGKLLAFSALDGKTDFQYALVARTAFDAPGLDFVLPGAGRIRFPVDPANGFVVTGDGFRLGTGADAIRGAFVDTCHLLLGGPCELLDHDPSITWQQRGPLTLIGATARFDPRHLERDPDLLIQARDQWLEQIPQPPLESDIARRTRLRALSIMKTQVYSPEGQIRHRWTTPDRWPHRRMWLWDSAFHAIGWRHLDPSVARDALSAVLDTREENGFVAHVMTPDKCSAITQPPVLALGAKLVHERHPSPEWIESLYPALGAYLEWDLAHRDRDGAGLVEWQIEGDPHCRSGESGMDNSPRFDAATRMDAVDFNAFLALECEIMSEFAAELGRPGEAVAWKSRHSRLCRLIRERLWSPEQGFFVDFDIEKQAPSPILAVSGFLPLICGAATAEQAESLLHHLHNPETFGTPFPVPSVAAFQAESYAKDMWRGPVWINLNWLIARGLDRYGYTREATTLRQQTLREIETHCESLGGFFEFYDAQKETPPPRLYRKGKCAPEESPYRQVVHDFGWTATLYVDMCYSFVCF